MRESVITFLQGGMAIEDNKSLYGLAYRSIYSISYVDFYTHIYTVDKKDILISCTLRKLLDKLPAVFVLCNKSTIVNLSFVKWMECSAYSGNLMLNNNVVIQVSRRKIKYIKDKLSLIIRENITCRDCFCCELNQRLCESNG